MLDLSGIPLVDNHCHGLYADTSAMTVDDYRVRFSESGGAPFPADHTATAPHYLWALRQIAGVLGCEPDEAAVVGARGRRSREELDRLFLGSAGVGWLLVDDGYPEPEACSSRAEMAARGGMRIGWLERVETVAARLAQEAAGFDGFDDALVAHLASARSRGVCGLKSVAAYRSGLAVTPPDRADAAAAFDAARRAGELRIAAKPLVDHVVLRAMEAARAQGLPVQFHTGYGDSDADLLLADPLHLAPLLRRFPDVPVVMLHGAYPFTRSLSVLAATYPNAYVDVSYAIPFLTAHELLEVTHQAMGAAPSARVLYSSDAVGIPEQHWLGAVRGRRAIAKALDEMVERDELDEAQALAVAERVLRTNAERIYGL